MRFCFSEELEMTRVVVRDFAENKVAPTARERDEDERFDRQLFDQMGQLGLTGIPWSETYGGAGGDFVTLAIVVEELSRVCASTGAGLADHIGYAGWPIYKFGSEGQKQTYLTAMAIGEMLGTGCLLQLQNERVGSKAGYGVSVSAGDGGEYILNGYVEDVNHAGEADIYVVFALGQPMKRKKRYSAFIVAKGIDGFRYGPKIQKLGMRSMSTGAVRFENCKVPRTCLIGQEGQGYEIALSTLGVSCIRSAAQAVGVAQGSMDAAAAYARERKQFGKPIAQQQAILFKLADMSARIEAARLLCYQAAYCLDAGLPYRKEAAMARMYAVRAAEFATIEAVQIFGGYGYMKEYHVERYMRDARCLTVGEGTAELRSELLGSMLNVPTRNEK